MASDWKSGDHRTNEACSLCFLGGWNSVFRGDVTLSGLIFCVGQTAELLRKATDSYLSGIPFQCLQCAYIHFRFAALGFVGAPYTHHQFVEPAVDRYCN